MSIVVITVAIDQARHGIRVGISGASYHEALAVANSSLGEC